MTLITIIVPLFNEEKNLRRLYSTLDSVTESLKPLYDFYFLFVNDGSTDETSQLLLELVDRDRRCKYIEFSKNFGKEIATSAGLIHAEGEAVIMIDADLQHPVELLGSFLQRWREGCEIVIGVRRGKSGVSSSRRYLSHTFNFFMNLIGETKVVYGATDYRLLDSAVVKEFKRFSQQNRLTRNLIDWLGFKRSYLYFDASERSDGEAKFSWRSLIRLATTALVSNSLLPLRAAGVLGVVITTLSGVGGVAILVGKYMVGNPFLSSFTGPAQLAILITFLIGIVLISLGIMALYIAQIHSEVMGKPLYVIRRTNVELN